MDVWDSGRKCSECGGPSPGARTCAPCAVVAKMTGAEADKLLKEMAESGIPIPQRSRYHGVILHEWNEGLFDEVWVCEHQHYSVDDAKDCAKQSAANRGGLDPRQSVIAVSVGEPRQGIPTGPKVKGNRG